MSINQPPDNGAVPPPMPPAPPPMPGGMPAETPGPASSPSKGLQITSLVAGIVSFLCLPVIAAIVAIITGFMGRSKAKAAGEPAGMAIVGIVLGVLNLLASIVLAIVVAVAGLSVFGFAATQIAVADELARASVAAQQYGAANGSFVGIDETVLEQYGYQPSSDVVLYAYANADGSEYCVEAALVGNSTDYYHAPVFDSDSSTMTIELNGRSISYAKGECP